MRVAAGLVLAILACRAWVPAGFMPASGAPFALEICPDGLSAPMHRDHANMRHAGMHHEGMHHEGMAGTTAPGSHHDGNRANPDTCPFGSVPAAAPLAHVVAMDVPEHLAFQPLFAFSPAQSGTAPARAHRARGPPSPA